MIAWPDCRNVRDLSSVPGVRAGAVIRSDSLTHLTKAGLEAVRAANVSRVVDLRTASELAAKPNPFADDTVYCHRSLYPDPIPPAPDGLTPVEEYAWALELSPDRFADAVGAIASAPQGTVVVHCQGGADRTGLVVALALTAVGIGRDRVIADYVRSPEARAETLAGALDHVESRYGNVKKYLGFGGLTSAGLSTLRDRLVLDAEAG